MVTVTQPNPIVCRRSVPHHSIYIIYICSTFNIHTHRDKSMWMRVRVLAWVIWNFVYTPKKLVWRESVCVCGECIGFSVQKSVSIVWARPQDHFGCASTHTPWFGLTFMNAVKCLLAIGIAYRVCTLFLLRALYVFLSMVWSPIVWDNVYSIQVLSYISSLLLFIVIQFGVGNQQKSNWLFICLPWL